MRGVAASWPWRQRRPADVIHPSDQGYQYTSVAFGKRGAEAGRPAVDGSVGDAYDALGASFFATLECELLDRHRFRTQVEARLAVFDCIEGWYNPRAAIPHSISGHRCFLSGRTRSAAAQCPQDRRSTRGRYLDIPSEALR